MHHTGKQNPVMEFIWKGSLVVQILIGLAAGIVLAILSPDLALKTALAGDLFINALKSVAPILVFVLVAASIANQRHGQQTRMGSIVVLYLAGTFLAALVAVVASYLFPLTIQLKATTQALSPPGNVGEVLSTLLFNVIDNPVNALVNANYMGILAWAIAIGLAMRHAHDATKHVLGDLSQALSFIVKIVIRFAPIGIFGLVASTAAETGFGALLGYARLLAVLIGCMVFVALVVNPLIVLQKFVQIPIRWYLPACARAASPRFSCVAQPPTSPSTWLCAKSSACPKIPIRYPYQWAQPLTWQVQPSLLRC